MFGLALRSYQQKVQRLSESVTDHGRTLWEALHDYLQQKPGRLARRRAAPLRARRSRLGARHLERHGRHRSRVTRPGAATARSTASRPPRRSRSAEAHDCSGRRRGARLGHDLPRRPARCASSSAGACRCSAELAGAGLAALCADGRVLTRRATAMRPLSFRALPDAARPERRLGSRRCSITIRPSCARCAQKLDRGATSRTSADRIRRQHLFVRRVAGPPARERVYAPAHRPPAPRSPSSGASRRLQQKQPAGAGLRSSA